MLHVNDCRHKPLLPQVMLNTKWLVLAESGRSEGGGLSPILTSANDLKQTFTPRPAINMENDFAVFCCCAVVSSGRFRFPCLGSCKFPGHGKVALRPKADTDSLVSFLWTARGRVV